MTVWLLPLLLLGAVVLAAASRSPRVELAPQLAYLPPPPMAALPPPPGPISVLGEFVRIGQYPPPEVIICAIAEAEAIGRDDLASNIVRVFVAPIVYQHAMASPRGAPAPHDRGCTPVAHERGSCAPARSPRAPTIAPTPPIAIPAAQLAPRPLGMPQTDEEIRAMLNADPQGFIAMVTRVGPVPVIDVPIAAAQPAISQPTPPMPPMPTPPPPPIVQSTDLPPEAVAQMQEAAGLHEAADETRAMVPGSPIAGVPDDAWREFVTRLDRESPLFNSSRHVGRYRQRRERLAELGIDPNVLLGSAQGQRAAIDVDLADAHHHAAAGGLIAEHLGRPISVPGLEGNTGITLSGLLGVIQCAGLEGAVGWLERASDRRRYPHTTQAFARTNGVF